MNTTGCPPLYAVDNFFDPHPDTSECELSILALVIFSELSGLVHLAVLIKRTQIIRSNWKKRKPISRRTILAILPYVTLFQSTGTLLTTVLTPLVWYFYSPAGIMAAFIYLFFAIQCETWLAKLIRLGGRVIPRGQLRTSITMVSGTDSTLSLEYLSRSDYLLKLIAIITRSGIVVQFVIGVIIYPLNPDDEFWFKLCITFQAILPTCWMIAINWQYRRCELAMIRVTREAKDVQKVHPAAITGISLLLSKMRIHRMIISLIGLPGVLIHFIWAAGASPLRYYAILVAFGIDIGLNGGVLYTYVRKAAASKMSSKKPTQETTSPSRENQLVPMRTPQATPSVPSN